MTVIKIYDNVNHCVPLCEGYMYALFSMDLF